MTGPASDPASSSTISTSSRPLSTLQGPTSPDRTHAMSTRSSQGLPNQQQSLQLSAQSSSSPTETHGLPSVPGRLTRRRARSINVEEANHPRIEELSIRSPALGGPPPPSATGSDLICICPSPPKVPRPRNGMCPPGCLDLSPRNLFTGPGCLS